MKLSRFITLALVALCWLPRAADAQAVTGVWSGRAAKLGCEALVIYLRPDGSHQEVQEALDKFGPELEKQRQIRVLVFHITSANTADIRHGKIFDQPRVYTMENGKILPLSDSLRLAQVKEWDSSKGSGGSYNFDASANNLAIREMTPVEVAVYLHVSIRDVARWVKQGLLTMDEEGMILGRDVQKLIKKGYAKP